MVLKNDVYEFDSNSLNHVPVTFRYSRSIFRAIGGQGLMVPDSCDGQIDIGEESSTRKLLVGIIVALGSFSASSPHFFLNLLTVFSCSISLVSDTIAFQLNCAMQKISIHNFV